MISNTNITYAMNTCRAGYCKQKTKHITKGHKCGICREFGHGAYECNKQDLINKLKEDSKIDTLNTNTCISLGCNFFELHTSGGHYCADCGEFHIFQNCPKNKENVEIKKEIVKKIENKIVNYTLLCPICKTNNIITNLNDIKIFVEAECVICCDNKVNIMLPCKHAVMCDKCFMKIKIENTSTISSVYTQIEQ